MMRLTLALLATALLSGCGVFTPLMRSEGKLSELELNLPRGEVLSRIGSPDAVRGATRLADGSAKQIDEYRLYAKSSAFTALAFCPITLTISCWFPRPGDEASYWLSYVDGRLYKWGRAGDWQPDFTSEIRVINK